MLDQASPSKIDGSTRVASDAARKRRATQQRHRAKLTRSGLVQCNLWVPAAAHADMQLLAEILREHPHLTIGPLRDPQSGKLVSFRR
jgi:hypothetical protein